MRIFALLGAATLLSASAVCGQNVTAPGQLADLNTIASRTNFSPDANGLGAGVSGPSIANVEDSHDKRVRWIWMGSMAAMLAGTAADAYTSWHKHESNGLLASSNGTFGAQGVSIKAAIAGGSLLPQILLRKRRDWRTAFAVGNFAQAGIFTGAAVHNLQTK